MPFPISDQRAHIHDTPLRLLTAAEMKRVDRRTIEEHGVRAWDLMDEAGIAAWREIDKRWEPAKVLVLAGKGNNGGDGLVIAREAHVAGAEVELLLLADPDDLSPEAFHHYERLPMLPKVQANAAQVRAALDENPDVVVDALLGIGLRGELRGDKRAIIEMINGGAEEDPAAERPWLVVAVDIPSGLSADVPWIGNVAVRADLTVTFGSAKPGQLTYPGADFVGELVVHQLSFPHELLDAPHLIKDSEGHVLEDTFYLMTKGGAAAALPERPADSHKGTFGTALLIGGSVGYGGAPILMARAAAKGGAGLVKLFVPGALASSAVAASPSTVTIPLGGSDSSTFDEASIGEILEQAEGTAIVALGPGIGLGSGAQALVQRLVSDLNVPLLLDADALTLLSHWPGASEACRARKAPLGLTPHPGEMARLLDAESNGEIQFDRFGAAAEAAEKYNAVVLLKGALSITARMVERSEFTDFTINPTGNSGLARGGSGDLLLGLAAALGAQRPPRNSVEIANLLSLTAWLHGRAADIAEVLLPPHAIDDEVWLRHIGPAIGELWNRPVG